VERVDRARGSDGGSDDGDALCIRSADVVALTSDLAIDRDELADDLLDLGLLVGTSRGTGPVPAAGGRPGR
jgi:hypothetical protein